MSKQTPKIHTTLLLFYVDMRKKIESNKRHWISFRPQRWDVPYRKPSCLLREAPVCEKHIPKPAPNGKNLYHGMLMPLHDSMPSFMNFRRVLDLLEFKNQESQCVRLSDGGRVFEIHSHFLHGT
jgi:hypothetical protein